MKIFVWPVSDLGLRSKEESVGQKIDLERFQRTQTEKRKLNCLENEKQCIAQRGTDGDCLRMGKGWNPKQLQAAGQD